VVLWGLISYGTLLHVDSTSAINWTKKMGKSLRGYVSSMPRRGSQTLLSRSHVSTKTGGCTYPIYYRLSVLTKEAWYFDPKNNKLAYQKRKILTRETPFSRGHVSSITRAWSWTLLSRSHVSSKTHWCTCPIYYQGVVSVEKGSAITRYTLPELIKKVSEENLTLPWPCFKHE